MLIVVTLCSFFLSGSQRRNYFCPSTDFRISEWLMNVEALPMCDRGAAHLLRSLKGTSTAKLRVLALQHCFLSSAIVPDIVSFINVLLFIYTIPADSFSAQVNCDVVLLLEGIILSVQEREQLQSTKRVVLSPLVQG